MLKFRVFVKAILLWSIYGNPNNALYVFLIDHFLLLLQLSNQLLFEIDLLLFKLSDRGLFLAGIVLAQDKRILKQFSKVPNQK